MKVLILYRSYFGNTKQVADAIAQQMKSAAHEVELRDVRLGLPDLAGIDAIVLGAPTRRGRVARKVRNAIRALKRNGCGDKPIAMFDTISMSPPTPLGSLLLVSRGREESENAKKWLEPGAVGAMQQVAREIGLNLFPEVLRCEVIGTKGPLAVNAAGKAAAFAAAFSLFAQKNEV